MNLKILLVTMLGVAGVASSYALANGGKDHGRRDVTATTSTTTCQHTSVLGTASVPQNLVVTVKKSGWKNSPFAPGQVITVSVGQTGDTVNVIASGCASGSTLTARGAGILVAPKPRHHGRGDDHQKGKGGKGDHHTTTTAPVTTKVVTTTAPVTTTTDSTTTDSTSTGTTTTTP